MKQKNFHDWQTSMISGGREQTSSAVVPAPVRRKSRGVVPRNGNKVALDRWENPVSGYGMQGVDPAASTYFQFGTFFTVQQLDALYKNWLARRIVELLPDAALQRGFIIKSKEDLDGNELEPAGAQSVADLLEEWKTETWVKHLGYQARLYGGAAKINFINDGLPTGLPVNESMIQSLDRNIIIGRFYCRPWRFYDDSTDLKTFKKPWIYQVFEIAYYVSMPTYQVHHSRLSWMDGAYLPDHMKIRTWNSGQTILELVEEALKAYGSSIQSLTAILQDCVTKVLQIEDLDDLLEENEEELDYRIRKADAQSNIHKTSVIGSREDYKKIATPIEGIPKGVSLLMDNAASAANIQKSKLFGHMTGTLGSSSGKYDKANWDDQVETWQKEKAQPIIEDDMRIACAITRTKFENLKIIWPPVREKGDQEIADIRKTNAEAESIEISNEQKRQEQ